ncbi:hypothetical protein HMPREF0058_1233 [Actinomyces urogenitalis DSM 15434]|jgi:hypothetical protein|uniref:Uncharacterized protein n=1 Tax=Actinomyces urogenitalis DSM 15434 TaxID=525246 RepID=C0W5T9_9ACTO|nr:hypothetical protein [Actinomyces urogenitalis]EEH65935.1 hypothetical protein HMPREF0058_1233 [Actinomyces urogenitalis DSM 15434]MDK8236803.1 hypothetical protein [Actinomyces urogenitalis]MDU6151222.1 hypothetical protein [Actinomyces urogenitalis]WOO94867.1 hypothetical protein R3I39_09305 [Actinomyces urogenitalis]
MSLHADAEYLRSIAEPPPGDPPIIMGRHAGHVMDIADRLDDLDGTPSTQPATASRSSAVGAAIGYLLMAMAGAVIVSLALLAMVEIWRAIL